MNSKTTILCIIALYLLSACATEPVKTEQQPVTEEYYDKTGQLVVKESIPPPRPVVKGNFQVLNKGNGNYLDINRFRKTSQAEKRDGKIELNFDNADINEVVSIIIGKILNENYLIDPMVKGTVNLQTVRGLDEESVFFVLENILDINGARITRHQDHYRILPKNKSALSVVGIAGRDSNAKIGYGYRIVPLRYVSADEMVKILESVTDKNAVIRSDAKRNLLILGGTGNEVKNMLDTVKLFDIDMMKGTSVALVGIRYSRAVDVIDDVKKMLQLGSSGEGIAAGIVSLEAIERLNSIMVISRNYSYLEKVEEWVKKLDVPEEGENVKLFVYPVRYTTAELLASTINDLFGSDSPDQLADEDEVLAPGSQPIALKVMSGFKDKTASTPEKQETDSAAVSQEKTRQGIKIVPATDSNTLLIKATESEYIKILEALELLDTSPLQVLIEVSIMDVRLTDELSYGVQWFFRDSGTYQKELTLGDDLNFAQTLSYSAIKDTGDVIALLSMLASDGKVNVLSSPSLVVRNNEKASIRVGDQQPISTALVGPEGNIVATSVEFKDTGVILEIKPIINSNGAVSVNINQEVTDIGDIDEATGQRAFLRRSIKSAVSVGDGETIVLGGLIRTNNAEVESGVPGLRDIPLLGFLFSKTQTVQQRSELIITLTPRVMRGAGQNYKVIEEYKKKFKHLPDEFLSMGEL